MKKEDIKQFNGRDLVLRLENSIKDGKITRLEAKKVYDYWINHRFEDNELIQEAIKVFS